MAVKGSATAIAMSPSKPPLGQSSWDARSYVTPSRSLRQRCSAKTWSCRRRWKPWPSRHGSRGLSDRDIEVLLAEALGPEAALKGARHHDQW